MTTGLFLQARMGSKRLPGKTLKEVCGKPILALILERLKRCAEKEKLVVLTTTQAEDAPIVACSEKCGVNSFRGSEEDVLDRFYQAAKFFEIQMIIRATADCPFIDPELVDEIARFFKKGSWDYVSNTLIPTFPDGLDTEVFHFEALQECWREAKQKYQREHVTPFFYEHPDRFRLANYRSRANYSGFRWIVDQEEDLQFVREVYERLYPKKCDFPYRDVLALLEEEPWIQKINGHLPRNEGFFKSLAQDSDKQKNSYRDWNDYIHSILERTGATIYETVGT